MINPFAALGSAGLFPGSYRSWVHDLVCSGVRLEVVCDQKYELLRLKRCTFTKCARQR
jgi:hypothetical protein